MASIKDLKKNINAIAGELFSECLFCRLYIPGADSGKAEKVMTKILGMQDNFLKRSNHPDGTKNSSTLKSYYRTLKTDLKTQAEQIIQDILSLNK